ncbi:uncharacterized protein si:ch211-188c16.1 isoform X2 [Anabas testudineus]|uniref:Helically-extended SH3 domain-containing protein n=1 Tax=Anabas testudineus TaxID=64144 RepID=A0A3Q1H824_ANATE|nr:uncharacterized protein si:ch211-188c16.1 isoform X2 [Anabas testudineus]
MEERPINFKALMAKFQEEALLAQSKTSRPAVAEKPKLLPPPGGPCSSTVTSINSAVEHKIAGVVFRDGLGASGSKRPISFPPLPQKTSPSPPFTNGDSTTRQSLKERHMPLVLPFLSVKEQKSESQMKREQKLESEQGKEVLPPPKIKKKGLLLPFKSAKAAKVSTENGEDPTYAELTTRPASAPGELPSVEKLTTEEGSSIHNDQSTAERPLSSPDVMTSPYPVETNALENKIISTLERAKKKFSCQPMLISTKAKSLLSPDHTSRVKAVYSPPENNESVKSDLNTSPPVCLPHIACISARPFSKANNCARKSPLDKQFSRDKAQPFSVRAVEPFPPSVPLRKPLPDLKSLGPPPAKPRRPPLVDLIRYYTVNEVSPGLSQGLPDDPESERPSISNTVLDAPDFPDFENSETETAVRDAVDIAGLELEALTLVSTQLLLPPDFEVTDFKEPQLDSLVGHPTEPSLYSVNQELNLGSHSIIPLDPASFPEPTNLSEFLEPVAPEQWSQSEEVIVDLSSNSPADENDLGAAEGHSATEETESSNPVVLKNGIQQHTSVYQQDIYFDRSDNLYEDVDINKHILGHNARKRNLSLKNPYAESQPMKEEMCPIMWSRNSRKERQSPNVADHKEQKKKEKQRLEKEKKEQKEREKKENEMKKKFKVTGHEEPMYHAKVMVASKVRKNDLPVKSGDTVSIIRTTNCPKGKWLARDTNQKYGYISVMNVELNIKDMLELGKKAQAAGRGGNVEADTISIGSRSSNHPVLTSSFTDDSEEWSCEDETLSPSNESHCPRQTSSMPDMSCGHVSAQHTLSDANLEDLHTQNRHEALQKLAIFFQHSKDEFADVLDGEGATPTNSEPPNFLCAVEEPPYLEQEADLTELELFPPPPLYADTL